MTSDDVTGLMAFAIVTFSGEAKRIHKETERLTGRPLAREMRARGIADASYKTVSNWTKFLRQKAK